MVMVLDDHPIAREGLEAITSLLILNDKFIYDFIMDFHTDRPISNNRFYLRFYR